MHLQGTLSAILGAVIFSAVSCSVDDNALVPEIPQQRIPMEFRTSDCPGTDTRTSITSDFSVLWSEKDAISIFDGVYNNMFSITEGAGTSYAVFAGNAMEVEKYYAFYPYSAGTVFDAASCVISAALPAEQHYSGRTFGTMMNPSAAVTPDGSRTLSFRNVASVLQVVVTDLPAGKSVREIQVRADKSLTGAYTVDMNADVFSAVPVSGESCQGVRLFAYGENSLVFGPYYLVVFPQTYASMTVTVIYSDDSYSERTFSDVDMPVSGGRSVTVDASSASVPEHDGLYGLFMAGQDIYIGGKAYNRSQFEDDEIEYLSGDVTVNSQATLSAGSVTYGKDYGHILFLAPDAVISNFAAQTDVIVVGDPGQKPKITLSANKYLVPCSGQESRLVLKNVDIAPAADFTSYFFTVNKNFSAEGAFGEFVLDGCNITMNNSPFYSISNARYLDRFVMENCTVDVPDGAGNRFILHAAANENAYSEIIFRNNIFRNTGAGALNFRLVSGNVTDDAGNITNATSVGRIVVENNTFFKTAWTNTAMAVALDFGEARITRNLFYLRNTNIPSGQGAMNILRAVAADGYPDSAYCIDNILYNGSNKSDIPAFNMFYNATFVPDGGVSENSLMIDKDPYAGGHYEDFIPNADYMQYGVQKLVKIDFSAE